MNPKENKYKENYTQVHCTQTVETNDNKKC